MKTVIFAAAIAAAAVSAPAIAQDAAPFTGPRAGVTAGYDSFLDADGFAYGLTAGYDVEVTSGVTFGPEVSFGDTTTGNGGGEISRDLAASVRLGYVLNPQLLVFGKVGYANTRLEFSNSNNGSSVEGVRFGGGLEYAVNGNTYISAEYQRTEYEDNIGGRDAGVVGVGFRF